MSTSTTPTPPQRIPAGATAEGDGIIVSEGPVRVDLFVDFLCPFCRAFEERAADILARLAADGAVDLVYHPVAFLERLSTAHYPSRASAASGAAADGGRFVEFKDALFASQPEEGGPGLSDEELVGIGAGVGLDEEHFGGLVHDQAYLPWTAYLTAQAIEDGVGGTPTVFVDGEQLEPEPSAIEAAVDRARPR
jgi:protein-disulfide isomerase